MNSWDERYGTDHYQYGTDPNDFLRAEAHRLPSGSRVLCLADGEGRNGVFLAGLGHHVTSVDLSPVGLRKASALADARGVSLTTVVADLAEYDPGVACWDGVVSIFNHLPPAVRALLYPRVARALVPGGLLLLEHYHPRQLGYATGGPPDAAMMITLADLAASFPGFEALHAFEGEREVHEGALHNGVSVVTQWVARRPSAVV